MTKKPTVEKVICYIVRGSELLVFRHVDFSFEEVGIQVPAGTIHPDEPPIDAAIREAQEETGIKDLKVVRKLGVVKYDVSPYRFEVHKRHIFLMEAVGETSDRWFSQEDHDGAEEPTRFECFWIPLEAAHVLQSGQGALIGTLFE